MKTFHSAYKSALVASGLLILANLTSARGAVDFTAPQTIFNVAQGGSFTLTLNLNITGTEQVTGIDYFWQVNSAGSGKFSIANRNIGASVFSFLNNDEPTVEASPGNSLAPTNQVDLGAGLQNVNSYVSTGSYLVANFTFNVSNSAPAGVYVLSPTFESMPYGDWVGAGPDYDNNGITAPLDVTVTVAAAPEPNIWLMVVVGGCLLFAFTLARGYLRPAYLAPKA